MIFFYLGQEIINLSSRGLPGAELARRCRSFLFSPRGFQRGGEREGAAIRQPGIHPRSREKGGISPKTAPGAAGKLREPTWELPEPRAGIPAGILAGRRRSWGGGIFPELAAPPEDFSPPELCPHPRRCFRLETSGKGTRFYREILWGGSHLGGFYGVSHRGAGFRGGNAALSRGFSLKPSFQPQNRV